MQCEWVEQVGCSDTTVTIYSMLGMLRNMLDYPNTWPRVDAMREFTSVPYERLQPSFMPHDDTPMSPSIAHRCADERTCPPPPHFTRHHTPPNQKRRCNREHKVLSHRATQHYDDSIHRRRWLVAPCAMRITSRDNNHTYCHAGAEASDSNQHLHSVAAAIIKPSHP